MAVKLRLAGFKGEIPRIHPRLLPEDASQIARNTRLENGALVPLNETDQVNTLAAPALTIFRRPGGAWLSWPDVVNAVSAPAARQRTYITGPNPPRVLGNIGLAQDYPLALPAPTVAFTVAPIGVVDPATAEGVFYTYTWLTVLDEESQPAPLSALLVISTNITVNLSGWPTPPAGRGITHLRVYRSQTNSLGATDLYYVAQYAVGVSQPQNHSLATAPLQEIIPTTDYDPPIDELQGITACANGIMAAFEGKDLWFSEPYRPHAWPTKYSLSVDFEIVGLAAIGAAVVVMTTGTPYIAQGTHPDAMVLQRIEQNLPCIAAQGIVDLGFTVVYPSTEGLVTVSPNSGAQLVTRTLFTRPQWAELDAETFIAGQHIGRYIASYLPSGAATREILIIDMTGEQPYLMRSSEAAEAMFFEIGTGKLYLLLAGTQVHEWDDLAEAPKSMTWRSRLYNLPGPTNFAAILVEADGYTAPNIANAVKVYADGVLRDTITTFNEATRLSSGFLALRWEFEVIGTVTITSISVAQSIAELAVQ
jgi:hypothetical protein